MSRLVVDWSLCAGEGVCAAALGEVVAMDPWGYPRGVDARGVPIAGELEGAARLAVLSCPRAALRLLSDRPSDAGSAPRRGG